MGTCQCPIGIAAAVGAFGGVFVNIAIRQSILGDHNGSTAYIGFIVYYLLCAELTIAVYLRPGRSRSVRI